MKRMLALISLTALLFSTMPAHAATWFPDGNMLHRDPFCAKADLSFDRYYARSLEFDSTDDIYSAGNYTICESCTSMYESAEPTEVLWYYNPDGGKYYHRNANCPGVKAKYTPLSGVIEAESPTWMPENACETCGYVNQVLRSASDLNGWNASIEEKANLLPGVWTLPSQGAVSSEAACSTARAHIAKRLSNKTYNLCPIHYDQGIPDEKRETWKVVFITDLLHPVCVVYIDALTGEVYTTIVAEEFADQYK